MIWLTTLGGIAIFIAGFVVGHFSGFCLGYEQKEKKEKLETVHRTQTARA